MATKVAEKLFNINNVQSAKKVFKTCPKFTKFMLNNGETNMALRNYPCSLQLPIIELPDRLDRAAARYLRDNVMLRPKQLRIQATSLRNALWSRLLLVEKSLAQYLRNKVKQSGPREPPPLITEEMVDQLEHSPDPELDEIIISNASLIMRLHKTDINRNVAREMLELAVPIRYSKHLADLYLASRLAPNYAACCQVLYEIRRRCPGFRPRSMLDFGSGLGSALWAANSVWPSGVIQQHLLVDASTTLLAISEQLLQDDCGGGGHTFPPGALVTHRSFLSAPCRDGDDSLRHELVVSAYSLLEVTGGYLNRRELLLNLWSKTDQFLVLVELGTTAGFRAILEARDWLLHATKDSPTPAKVFAPCPHELPCPKSQMVCSFDVRYHDLRLNECTNSLKREVFSYLILSKGDIRQFQEDSEIDLSMYPRVVTYKAGGPIQDLCTVDGTVTRYYMHTGDRPLKRFVNKCQPGDLMPVVSGEEIGE